MSTFFSRENLQPETIRDIEAKIQSRQRGKHERLQWSCGCYELDERRIALCEWHNGMDYGLEVGKAAQDTLGDAPEWTL